MNSSLTRNHADYGGAVCISGRKSDTQINNSLFSSNRATVDPDVHVNGTIKRLKVHNSTWSYDHMGQEANPFNMKTIAIVVVASVIIAVLFVVWLVLYR